MTLSMMPYSTACSGVKYLRQGEARYERRAEELLGSMHLTKHSKM